MTAATDRANGRSRKSRARSADQVADEAAEFGDEARRTALIETLRTRARGASTALQARPFTGVSAAFGVGLIIGLLIGR